MSTSQAAYRKEIDVIRAFLREWDPVGVIPALLEDGLPPSEYDSYAAAVHALLARGGDANQLAAHLQHLRTEAMELPEDPARDSEVANRTYEWWRTREQPT
jgi:hypothetical protein